MSQNRDKSARFLLKISPEISRLPGKILATLPDKIPPWWGVCGHAYFAYLRMDPKQYYALVIGPLGAVIKARVK